MIFLPSNYYRFPQAGTACSDCLLTRIGSPSHQLMTSRTGDKDDVETLGRRRLRKRSTLIGFTMAPRRRSGTGELGGQTSVCPLLFWQLLQRDCVIDIF
jgi:hypothetical protein